MATTLTLATLHAFGDPPEAMLAHARRLARALAPRLTVNVVALAGPLEEDGGRAWTGWRSDDAREVARARALVVRALRRAPRPLVLFGFSQGAMVAAEVALTTSLRPDAAVLVGGFLAPAGLGRPRARTLARVRTRFLVLHGADDDAVPPDDAGKLAVRLAQHGNPVVLELFEGAGHEVTRAMVTRAAELLREAL